MTTLTKNQEEIISTIFNLQEKKNKPVCFYTSQYEFSGKENIYEVCKAHCEQQGILFAGFGNPRAITGLVKRQCLTTVDKGWRFHVVNLDPEFKIFILN